MYACKGRKDHDQRFAELNANTCIENSCSAQRKGRPSHSHDVPVTTSRWNRVQFNLNLPSLLSHGGPRVLASYTVELLSNCTSSRRCGASAWAWPAPQPARALQALWHHGAELAALTKLQLHVLLPRNRRDNEEASMSHAGAICCAINPVPQPVPRLATVSKALAIQTYATEDDTATRWDDVLQR